MTAFFDPPEVHRPTSAAVSISQLVDPKLFVECGAIAAKPR